MAQRFQSALSRRDRIWPTALFSGAVHAALVAFAILRGSGPDIDLEQKPIVAKLVRLGEERPKQLLPRKEQPPPPPAAAEPAPVPVPTAPVAPAPAVATAKPTAPTAAAPKPPASTKPPPGPASGRRTLSSVLDRVRSETAEEQYGSPDGDPLGDSSDGEEGDRYLALVKRALDDNFTAPAVISERERLHLQADVILFIEPDGRIDRFTFERRSGNGAFDAALERTVRTTRVPPPPPEKREAYRRGGIRLTYRPS
jgi:colicin import membrane protein